MVELYPELSDLLYSIINETAMPSAPVFKQRVIVSRCIDRFVANGFTDIQSVENACARINSDDLALHTAIIPADVVAIIYKTIHSMRKQACCFPFITTFYMMDYSYLFSVQCSRSNPLLRRFQGVMAYHRST